MLVQVHALNSQRATTDSQTLQLQLSGELLSCTHHLYNNTYSEPVSPHMYMFS